tara:strand:+ start:668 stop:1111 length:444 start_codon:yes stop_codon:yes gene_type:complete
MGYPKYRQPNMYDDIEKIFFEYDNDDLEIGRAWYTGTITGWNGSGKRKEFSVQWSDGDSTLVHFQDLLETSFWKGQPEKEDMLNPGPPYWRFPDDSHVDDDDEPDDTEEMKDKRIEIRRLEMEKEQSAIHLLGTKFGKKTDRLTFRF